VSKKPVSKACETRSISRSVTGHRLPTMHGLCEHTHAKTSAQDYVKRRSIACCCCIASSTHPCLTFRRQGSQVHSQEDRTHPSDVYARWRNPSTQSRVGARDDVVDRARRTARPYRGLCTWFPPSARVRWMRQFCLGQFCLWRHGQCFIPAHHQLVEHNPQHCHCANQ